MEPSRSVAQIIIARVFELIDAAGEVVARLGTDGFSRFLQLFPDDPTIDDSRLYWEIPDANVINAGLRVEPSPPFDRGPQLDVGAFRGSDQHVEMRSNWAEVATVSVADPLLDLVRLDVGADAPSGLESHLTVTRDTIHVNSAEPGDTFPLPPWRLLTGRYRRAEGFTQTAMALAADTETPLDGSIILPAAYAGSSGSNKTPMFVRTGSPARIRFTAPYTGLYLVCYAYEFGSPPALVRPLLHQMNLRNAAGGDFLIPKVNEVSNTPGFTYFPRDNGVLPIRLNAGDTREFFIRSTSATTVTRITVSVAMLDIDVT